MMTPAQYNVLVWFCKEVAKAVFLEVLALTFLPSAINVFERPSLFIIIGGTIFSLTFLWLAVMLTKKSKKRKKA